MAFPARFAGTCSKCSQPINKGQYITWSRRERGKASHVDCANPDAIPTVPTVPTVPVTPMAAASPELIAEIMRVLEAKKGIAAPEVDDLEAPIAKVPKPVVAPKTASEPKPIATLTEWWDRLAVIAKAVTPLRALLIGPPGTGKSKTGMIAADTDYELTMTEGTAVEDVIGMFQLKNNETVWVDGPAVSAMRVGKKLVINEIDHYATEIGSLLYALMDDNPSIMLPTGERVVAASGYGVIATSNANITSLPEAIVDRCDVVIAATKPHPEALKLLEDSKMVATVSNYFATIDTKPWTFSRKPTLRVMRAFKMLKPIVGETVAAELAFGNSATEIISVMSTADRKDVAK